jgi:hypothetical protein
MIAAFNGFAGFIKERVWNKPTMILEGAATPLVHLKAMGILRGAGRTGPRQLFRGCCGADEPLVAMM